MGRLRKHNKHLPRGMLKRHGAYYFIAGGKWARLSDDYGKALVKYAELVGGSTARVLTVKDAIAHYLESSAKRLAPATLAAYEHSQKRLVEEMGEAPLDQVKAAHVYEYLVKEGNIQANRDKALLSAAYTHARRIGAFEGDDPAKKLQYRNQEKPRDRYVTDTELDALLDKASPKLACIARFIELTGMRQGDALRVRLADIDEEGVHYRQAKTGKRLVVLWSTDLQKAVDDAKRLWRRFGREYLFESVPKGKHAKRGPGPYTPSGLRALWRVARTRAKLTDVRLHDLRRKAGSDVASDQDAQALLGHGDVKVTKRHYRAKPSRVRPVR